MIIIYEIFYFMIDCWYALHTYSINYTLT